MNVDESSMDADAVVVGGFRQRGLAMTRIETFTDAAFAFSLTLLVISFDHIPTSFDEFKSALLNIPAFAGSFATLAMFWFGHHLWSRRFGLDDGLTALLSLLFVFVMLIYVYPLKMVTSGFFAWVTAGRLPFVFGEIVPEQITGLFVIYGVGFAAMSLTLALHYAHAWRRREVLQLDPLERFATRSEWMSWLILTGAGVVSVAWALLLPPRIAIWAGFANASLAFIMPTFAILRDRHWQALQKDQ